MIIKCLNHKKCNGKPIWKFDTFFLCEKCKKDIIYLFPLMKHKKIKVKEVKPKVKEVKWESFKIFFKNKVNDFGLKPFNKVSMNKRNKTLTLLSELLECQRRVAFSEISEFNKHKLNSRKYYLKKSKEKFLSYIGAI